LLPGSHNTLLQPDPFSGDSLPSSFSLFLDSFPLYPSGAVPLPGNPLWVGPVDYEYFCFFDTLFLTRYCLFPLLPFPGGNLTFLIGKSCKDRNVDNPLLPFFPTLVHFFLRDTFSKLRTNQSFNLRHQDWSALLCMVLFFLCVVYPSIFFPSSLLPLHRRPPCRSDYVFPLRLC